MEPRSSHRAADVAVVGQLRRGVLDYCVIALLRDQEMYAGDLVRRLATQRGLAVSEGTVYPLLSRLRRDGLVTSRLSESAGGAPRRYYQLTADGAARLAAFTPQWRQFRDAVDATIGDLGNRTTDDTTVHHPVDTDAAATAGSQKGMT